MLHRYTRIANGKLKCFRWQLFSYDRVIKKNILKHGLSPYISVEIGIYFDLLQRPGGRSEGWTLDKLE